MKRYGFALRPGWVLFHLFAFGSAVTMVLLGRWQLHVSESKHFNLQNFGYSIQWWLFTAFALFFWWRVVRDSARRRTGNDATNPTPAEPATAQEAPVAYRRYVMPTVSPRAVDDPVHAAYNDYLARLAARDAEQQR